MDGDGQLRSGQQPDQGLPRQQRHVLLPHRRPNAGKAYRFAVGPVDAEMTGPVWSPDGKTLFVSIQHPGEDSESLDQLTSNFAAAPGSRVPRPTLVAISGFPGWKA
ncbi:alkaline phosphatase PhoX [Deinococcus radiophilus]|uniref:alkaline phosphatase PhoX n=1 Tax=Deinococcus radiophilus TaxID=32062 RepID=UPI00360E4D2C